MMGSGDGQTDCGGAIGPLFIHNHFRYINNNVLEETHYLNASMWSLKFMTNGGDIQIFRLSAI